MARPDARGPGLAAGTTRGPTTPAAPGGLIGLRSWQRQLGSSLAVTVALACAVLVAGLPVRTAEAAELGGIDVRMTTGSASGTDASQFVGSLPDARCPAGTGDSFFTMEGPGLRPYEAALGPGNSTGTGPQEFSGASIANLRTNNAGSFLRSGTYAITFNCVRDPDGAVSDVYVRRLDYTAGGAGSVVIRPGPAAPAKPVAVPTPPPRGSAEPAAAAGPAGTTAPGAVRPSAGAIPSAAGPTGGASPAASTAVGRRASSDVGTSGSARLVGGLVVLTATAGLLLLLARHRQRTPRRRPSGAAP